MVEITKKTACDDKAMTSTDKVNPMFNVHWNESIVKQQLLDGELLQGTLRINPKNYEVAYITSQDCAPDVIIKGVHDRNAALHGDTVAVKLHTSNKWEILKSPLNQFIENNPNYREVLNQPVQKKEILNNVEETKFTDNKSAEKKPIKKNKKKLKETISDVGTNKSVACSPVTCNNESLEPTQSCTGNQRADPPLSAIEGNEEEKETQESVVSSVDPSSKKKRRKRKNKNKPLIEISQGSENSEKALNEEDKPLSKTGNDTKFNKSSNVLSENSGQNVGTKFDKVNISLNARTCLPNKNKFKDNAKTEIDISSVDIKLLMRLPNWQQFIQRVGYVVHILERRNTRLAAGTLKPFTDMNKNMALFSPYDCKMPRMKVPMNQCPPDLLSNAQKYSRRIYVAKLVKWKEAKFALGELIRNIGEHGDIAAEMEAFLLQVGIDSSPFPEEVLNELQSSIPETGWSIPLEALEGRRDLRDACVFTIDPASARDLDDALSCERLSHDRYRVGVHIADVTYFLRQGSLLDEFAAERGNSVYLVDKVITMLPSRLSEQLCSLQPNQDRLTFSVIWDMDLTGKVLHTWYGRTVVRSCVKLSYEDAQRIIDERACKNKPDEELQGLPAVTGHSVSEVCEVVLALNGLAQHMRSRRHKHGALRLDQPKLVFHLDPETKLPNSVATSDLRGSNKLVEEFMLRANISVAEKILEKFPDHAVLRCHPQPHDGPLQNLAGLLHLLDIDLSTSSAGAIHESIVALAAGADEQSKAILQAIVNMVSKPMQNAFYFCAGVHPEDEFMHYALNVSCYTHFTSPIRRYPDVMVHRLLGAAVGDPQHPPFVPLDLKEIQRRLSIANEKKLTAKSASEFSTDLYLAEFVRQTGPMEMNGVVVGVLTHALDILLVDYCTIRRSYLERLPLSDIKYNGESRGNNPPSLSAVWAATGSNDEVRQSFTYLSTVRVLVNAEELKINVALIRPE